jgi:hypothetical protein
LSYFAGERIDQLNSVMLAKWVYVCTTRANKMVLLGSILMI